MLLYMFKFSVSIVKESTVYFDFPVAMHEAKKNAEL